MSYRLALLSGITVYRRGEELLTFDLWAHDLEAQTAAVLSLLLLAPVVEQVKGEALGSGTVLLGIRVLDPATLDDTALCRELGRVDVVQLPGNDGWAGAGAARRVLRCARSVSRPVIVGISSNRARTAWMNSVGKGPLARLRAAFRAFSVRLSQSYLASKAQGVFVVGEGLVALVRAWNRNVHVGTASWIRRGDVAVAADLDTTLERSRLRLGVAARLEPMKGVQIAIDALAKLSPETAHTARLSIAGVGPEEPALRVRARHLETGATVDFVGGLPYPLPFFAWLRQVDVLLITNLNDEQPRVVFDAITQGCLPISPDTVPYRTLGLPSHLLYKQGNAEELARCIERLLSPAFDAAATRTHLANLAREATIESMHADRAAWVEATVLGRR